MLIPKFNKEKREEILARYEELRNAYMTPKSKRVNSSHKTAQQRTMTRKGTSYGSKQKIADKMEECIKEYTRIIPRMKVSECPFTGEPLVLAFDPVGVDGFWWMKRTRIIYEGQSRPTTYRMLKGALNLQELPPAGGRHKAFVGPEVPYVIPRILELPNMIMVISSITLENGYVTYFLAYFSDKENKRGQLTSSWPSGEEMSLAPTGDWNFFKTINNSWDFDIEKWMKLGKIRWINPFDSTLAPTPHKLHERSPHQIIKESERRTGSLPDYSIQYRLVSND